MADNITHLNAVKRPVDEDMIECLEELLAAARDGNIRTLVYMAFYYDGSSDSGNVGELSNSHYVLGSIMGMGMDYWARRRKGENLDSE